MMYRLLAMLGIAPLMIGLATAQDTLSPKEKAEVKALVREAQEVAGEDLPKAITILEKALTTAPEDRNALFLMGAMSVVQGERAEEKAERMDRFRKSTASFEKLQKLFKELTSNEKRFQTRSRLGEARVLASEGKPERGFAAIEKAVDGGFDDFEALQSDPDLGPIRKLAAYKSLVETTTRAKLEAARKEVAEEIAAFKSFPFDFELKDVDDKTVRLADFKGKVTIVDVWGTWCPPCRAEIPHFVELYDRFKGKGLEIVGINCNEEGSREKIKKTIKDFAKETRITYQCVLNDDETEKKIPGFQGYPTTLFLDRSGKVRMMFVGNPGKAKLEAVIDSLLADSSKTDAAGAN